jgi:hypothetical protein
MSFNFRDDNGLFGPNASVELANGASAPTIVKMQLVENVTFSAIAAGNALNTVVWTAPAAPGVATGTLPLGQYSLVEVQMRATAPVTSGATTFQIERLPSGTGTGSGTNLLSAAINLTNLVANTVTTAVPSTSLANANVILAPGDSLGVLFGGTLTGLANLVVTLSIVRSL